MCISYKMWSFSTKVSENVISEICVRLTVPSIPSGKLIVESKRISRLFIVIVVYKACVSLLKKIFTLMRFNLIFSKRYTSIAKSLKNINSNFLYIA